MDQLPLGRDAALRASRFMPAPSGTCCAPHAWNGVSVLRPRAGGNRPQHPHSSHFGGLLRDL